MPYRVSPFEKRSFPELKAHYDLEKHLADQLRRASAAERTSLYTKLYNELYAKIPHLKTSARDDAFQQRAQFRGVKRFLSPDTTFLEVGPGNCALSIEVAKHVKNVVAVDVSDEFTTSLGVQFPANMKLVISDGSSIPVPPQSITVAYSTQLMEHLHPEDAKKQLRGIADALAPGGRYICITPHRYSGPHDISRYFTDEATGFHLKEYTNAEINNLFRSVGLVPKHALVGVKGWFIVVPFSIVLTVEQWLDRRSTACRRRLANFPLGRALLGVRVIATKGQ